MDIHETSAGGVLNELNKSISLCECKPFRGSRDLMDWYWEQPKAMTAVKSFQMLCTADSLVR